MSRRQTAKSRQPHRKRPAESSTTTHAQPVRQQRPARRWPWVAGLLTILVLCGLGFWHGLSSNTPPSASPVFSNSATGNSGDAATNWKTIQTFSGQATNGDDYISAKFTVTANWQITWTCTGIDGNDEQMDVVIYNPDGTLYNAGADITCLATQRVNGNVQETKAGTYYLDIDSSTAWTVHVQVQS